MNWDWFNKLMTNPVFYGQMAHFMGGAFILMTVAFLSNSIKDVGFAWLLLVAITAFKEFYYDTHFEIPAQDIAGGLRDFLSYQGGACLAFLITFLKLSVFK